MKKLVLWHGWGMHPDTWGSVLEYWDQDKRPHAQALSGYAGTPALPSLEMMVDDLLKNVATPIALCGWSLGAMAAMLAATRHPDKISHLILVSATPSFVQRPNWPHAIDEHMLTKLAEAIGHNARSALKRFIAMINQKDIRSSAIARELSAIILTALPAEAVLNTGLELLRQTDLRTLASSIRQPTLIIHGAHDPLMPLASAEWMAAAIPGARLDIFADAAHAPHLSDPARFAALIKNFINA